MVVEKTYTVLKGGNCPSPQRGQKKITVGCTTMGYFKEVTKNFWSTKDPDHKPFAFTCAAVNSIYRCQRLPMRMVAWFFLFVLLLSPASFTTTIASYCSDQKDCISCVSFEDDTSFPGYGCIWCTPRDQTWPEAPYCMSEYQQDYCKSDIISPTVRSQCEDLDKSGSDSSKLGAGDIAAIILGCVMAVVLGVGWWGWKRVQAQIRHLSSNTCCNSHQQRVTVAAGPSVSAVRLQLDNNRQVAPQP